MKKQENRDELFFKGIEILTNNNFELKRLVVTGHFSLPKKLIQSLPTKDKSFVDKLRNSLLNGTYCREDYMKNGKLL